MERRRVSWRENVANAIAQLDAIGFDYGHVRISLYRAVLAVFVAIMVIVVGRLASALSRRAFKRATRLDPTQQLLGEKLVSIGVWVVAVLIGIDAVGISLTALTVFSGAFGLAVGFGLQKTLGNLIAGIILLMDRSIKPGDVIAVNDGKNSTIGQVKKIGIRAVSVTTRDQIEYLIPNEILMTTQVENWSYSSREVRIKVPVTVSYGTDLALAESLLLAACREVPRVLNSPAPGVWVNAFAENGIAFEIQAWIDDPEEGIGNVRSDVLRAVWRLFGENAIEVPSPRRDVRVISGPVEAAVGGA
jgi:small-conductance mechanosensitive channel